MALTGNPTSYQLHAWKAWGEVQLHGDRSRIKALEGSTEQRASIWGTSDAVVCFMPWPSHLVGCFPCAGAYGRRHDFRQDPQR